MDLIEGAGKTGEAQGVQAPGNEGVATLVVPGSCVSGDPGERTAWNRDRRAPRCDAVLGSAALHPSYVTWSSA